MIATVVVSFTDWELGGTNSVHFIGWDNYIGLWESDDFRKSVGNTLFMTMLVVPTSFVLSLLLALAVHASGRLAQFWQSIYFLPVTASLVAMAVVWQWILHPEVGIVAAVLPYFGITQKVNFLNDARFVLWTPSFITVWQMTGYFMVIFLTGLSYRFLRISMKRRESTGQKVLGHSLPTSLGRFSVQRHFCPHSHDYQDVPSI